MKSVPRKHSILFALYVYTIVVFLILFIRPRSVFKPDGTMREFGISRPYTTMCPFWFICIASAVVIFLGTRSLRAK